MAAERERKVSDKGSNSNSAGHGCSDKGILALRQGDDDNNSNNIFQSSFHRSLPRRQTIHQPVIVSSWNRQLYQAVEVSLDVG